MITLPKPKFAETNVPIGKSKDDYKNEIIDKQTHVLSDAIDRVSFRRITRVLLFYPETLIRIKKRILAPDLLSYTSVSG